jgi:hypothetical protein
LADGAVDAPAAAHFTEMEDEFFDDGGEVHGGFGLKFQKCLKS